MLQFFRKYQKFFFLFVTTIIILSFVFFGTFQTFLPRKGETSDEVVFTALDGTKIKQFHFLSLVRFLAERGDFLNEGILEKHFLETKMGELLFDRDQEMFKQDLVESLKREKNYHPYVHPEAKFLNAESVWTVFAPEIKENLKKLKTLSETDLKEIYKTKVALLLAEKKFSAEMLSQVLRYQEREYPSLPPDLKLHRSDSLTLFGYRNLNDWFGSSFVEQLATVIVQGAAFAREKGLMVSKEEVRADLLHRSEKAFQSMKEELPPQISNPSILLSALIYQRGLNEETMLSIWNEILLFKRLLNEVAASVVIDALPLKEFYSQAGEKIICDVYKLPKSLHFQNKEELVKFESYLSAIQGDKKSIDLPATCASISEIEKRAPQLIAYPYVVEIAKIEKKELHGKISARETLEWQMNSNNWEILEKKFPELKSKKCDTSSLRSNAIDELERKKRYEVDRFTRNQMVNEHPEWLEEALSDAKATEKRIIFSGSETILEGINDPKAFKKLLDEQELLSCFTQDQEIFYRIKIKERSPREVVDFSGAKKLDLPHVEIEEENFAAPQRFLSYLKKRGIEEIKDPIAKQWNLVKEEIEITRGSKALISFEEAAKFEKDQFSDVMISAAEGPFFFQVKERKMDNTLPLDKMCQEQEMLSKIAIEHFFERELLGIIPDKHEWKR